LSVPTLTVAPSRDDAMTPRAYDHLGRFAARFPLCWTIACSVAMGLAAGACGLALRAALAAGLSASYPYEAFFLAVALAAAIGGMPAALSAAAIMAIGGWAAFGDWFGDAQERLGLAVRVGGVLIVGGLIVGLRGALLELRRK